MLLTLLIVFLVLSLLIIALGLFRPEHTELALIGFLFLFILSFIIMYGDIQYKTGVNVTYACLCCDPDLGVTVCNATNSSLLPVKEEYDYSTWSGGGTFSHAVGFWLVIMSVVGFIGVLLGIRKQKEIFD